MPPSARYGVLVGAQLAIASAAILARFGLAAGLGPAHLAAWRLTIASLILLPLLWLAGRPVPPDAERRLPARMRPALLAAGGLLGLHFAAWFASLRLIPVARSTLLVSTTPLWVGLAEAALGRRPPARFWVGLAAAGCGMWLVAGWSAHSALSGDLLALTGAASIAAYLIIVRPIQPVVGSWRMVAWTYSLAAVTMWPAAILLEPPAAHAVSSLAWTAVLGMAIFPQLIGHTALNWSLHHFSAAAVAAATLLEPAFAAALAWWLLGESITPRQGVGALILLGGVALALGRASSRSAE